MSDLVTTQKQGDALVAAFDAGKLTEKNDLILALSNKWFRLNTLYKILAKTEGDQAEEGKSKILRFRPNRAQRERFAKGHNRDLILKARQLGFTTFEMVDMLDSCLFTESYMGGCIAHTEKDAKLIYKNKVRFAYEHISEAWLAIFDEIGLDFPVPKSDTDGGYTFTNGSSMYVGVSFRGGTLDHLHVSEFGKICRMFPLRAEEVVTGAFEAVPLNGKLTIESTAEGQDGYFYEYSREAENHAIQKAKLTPLDLKFHFFPWWQESAYELDPAGVAIPEPMQNYFAKLEAEIGQTISPAKRAWYTKKAAVLKDKMKREYPGTPKEAFEQAIEGAYYAREMAEVRKEGRIRTVRYDPRLPVHTFWDLGRNDAMAIWFMQPHFDERRFIRYYENSGESIQFYLKKLQEFGYVYGEHYMPHDADVVDLSSADNMSRADIARAAGYRVTVVPRVPDKMDAIQAVRDILHLCYFDEENCAQGLKCLDNYRKDWDEKYGRWRDRPRHDWASHGNDSFEQFARGFSEITGPASFEPDFA